MRKLGSFVAAVVLTCSFAFAGQVRLVDASGAQNFSQIQPAIDAAPDGGLILVGPGIYTGFTVNAKSVSIVAVPGVAQGVVTVRGTIRIRNTTWQPVLLSGLNASGFATLGASEPGLELYNNAGGIRVQDCTFTGEVGDPWVGGWARPGASMVGNSQLAFERCTFNGSHGFYNYLQGGPGASGVELSSAVASFESCTFQGGAGGNSEDEGGDGGAGLHAGDGSMFFLSGSTCRGGKGGDGHPQFLNYGGDGGPGIRLVNGASADALGCTFSGGAAGQQWIGIPGLPIDGSGLTQHAGVARTLQIAALAADAPAVIHLTFTGQAGDVVHARIGVSGEYTPSTQPLGTRLVIAPPIQAFRPLGVIPASGVLQARVVLPLVAPGVSWRRYYVQGVLQSAGGGQSYYTGVNTVHVFDRDAGPDCDGNGVQDYVDVAVDPIADCNGTLFPDLCDIASGASADLNANGVPDECEGFTWYVDAAAPPGGTGTVQAPFQSIGQGIAAASSGHSILVRDGLYTGPNNRNLSFGGRDLVLRSVNGATNCVVDLQGLGKFLRCYGTNESSLARVSGFTLRNGLASGSSSSGGAIELWVSDVSIDGCRFENCQAPQGFGGAVSAGASGTRLSDCVFVGNRAKYGGALRIGSSTLEAVGVVSCLFDDNRADSGGAILANGQGTPIEISHCSFLANQATDPTAAGQGGAIEGLTLRIQHCLFAGNQASRGAAVSCEQVSNPWLTTLRDCTIVANVATQAGGALEGDLASLRNCVIWGNSSPSISCLPAGSPGIDLAWCTLEGGAGGTIGNVILGAGMQVVDPKFADPDGPDNNLLTFGDNDYRLALLSTCLDAGDNSAVGLDVFDLDADGNTAEPAPFDLLGAARFADIPSAPNTGLGVSPLVDLGCFERQP